MLFSGKNIKSNEKFKMFISAGLITTLLSGGSFAIYRTNPYIVKDIPSLFGERIVPKNYEETLNEYYKVYVDTFPRYKSYFDERIKNIKIYKTHYDRYVNSKMNYSIYYSNNDQILLGDLYSFPHELGHALSYSKKTGNCGFKTKTGKGKGLNEGFQTLLHSELFLDKPYEIKTVYKPSLGFSRILFDNIPLNEVTNIYFSEDKNIEDIILKIQEFGISLEDANKIIDELDKVNNTTVDLLAIANVYEMKPTEENKNKYTEISREYINNLKNCINSVLKVVNKIVTQRYNDTNESREELLSDIMYYTSQLKFMVDDINYSFSNNEDYKNIQTIKNILINDLSAKYNNEPIRKVYYYKSLFNQDKNDYIYNLDSYNVQIKK